MEEISTEEFSTAVLYTEEEDENKLQIEKMDSFLGDILIADTFLGDFGFIIFIPIFIMALFLETLGCAFKWETQKQ